MKLVTVALVFLILFLLFFEKNKLSISDESDSKYTANDLVCKDCNLILIVVHGLRSDHLSSFGYFRGTSPNIDETLRDSITFDSLISTSSDFTRNQKKIVSYNYTDLITFLKAKNYTTAAFFDGRPALDWFGDYQFDTFDNFPQVPLLKDKFENVSKFVEENKEKRFFMLVSSFEVHHPHRHPPSFYRKFDPSYSGVAENVSMVHHWYRLDNGSYTRLVDFAHVVLNHTEDLAETQVLNLEGSDIKNIVARYDEAIYHFDEFVGKLIDELKVNDMDKKTVIAITSDVGIQLFERGVFTHERAYDETIKLIFSINIPGIKLGKRISDQITHKDVPGILLQVLGLGIKPEISLIDAVNDKYVDSKFIVGRSDDVFLNCRFARSSEWKLIECRNFFNDSIESELYNLKDDPGETVNLMGKNNIIYTELKQMLA